MKKGFTVAEVLLAITIIGVICVLTLPSLSGKVQTTKTKKALKKGFAVLANLYTTEYVIKPAPATNNDGEKIMSAINKNLNIKYYLTCNEGVCEQQYTPQPMGSWVVTEDLIAYKIIKGESNCADKYTISEIGNSADATAATCLAILIDDGCLAKFNDERECLEIPDGTEEAATKIKQNILEGNQMRAFVSSTGITSGNAETVASGIIMSEND